MPKNAKGGKRPEPQKRELVLKEEEQDYATVIKPLGMGRMAIQCQDGSTRMGVICGRMRRGGANRINVGDIVLVSTREFEDGKVDIIGKYTQDEAKKLVKEGHMKAMTSVKHDDGGDEGQRGPVLFEDVEKEEDDEDDLLVNPNQKGEVFADDDPYADDDEDGDDGDVNVDDI